MSEEFTQTVTIDGVEYPKGLGCGHHNKPPAGFVHYAGSPYKSDAVYADMCRPCVQVLLEEGALVWPPDAPDPGGSGYSKVPPMTSLPAHPTRRVILLVDDERTFQGHPWFERIERHTNWQSAATRLRNRSDDIAEIWLDYVLKDEQTTYWLAQRIAEYHDDLQGEIVIRFVTSDNAFAAKLRDALGGDFTYGEHPRTLMR